MYKAFQSELPRLSDRIKDRIRQVAVANEDSSASKAKKQADIAAEMANLGA